MKDRLLLPTAIIAGIVLLAASAALYGASFNQKPIVLGQSCALSGPASNLGQELRAGVLAAFAEINEQVGIHGREILLESLDDGYDPTEPSRIRKS